jgi:hypothetical protein
MVHPLAAADVYSFVTRSSSAALALALVAVAFQPACHYVRLRPRDASVATEIETRRSHSTFWGLSSEPIAPENCHGNGLAEVSIDSNLATALLTLATLGFWNVADVSWSCAKDRAP